jgi:hypothetical protein
VILLADVYAAVKALWARTAAASLVPGGLWEGRPEQTAVPPYAVAMIAERDPQWTSGGVYVAGFELTITVYAATGVAATKPIQTPLTALLSRGSASLTVPGATTLDARAVPGAVTKDAAKKDASDVTVAAQKWELLFQGTR